MLAIIGISTTELCLLALAVIIGTAFCVALWFIIYSAVLAALRRKDKDRPR